MQKRYRTHCQNSSALILPQAQPYLESQITHAIPSLFQRQVVSLLFFVHHVILQSKLILKFKALSNTPHDTQLYLDVHTVTNTHDHPIRSINVFRSLADLLLSQSSSYFIKSKMPGGANSNARMLDSTQHDQSPKPASSIFLPQDYSLI